MCVRHRRVRARVPSGMGFTLVELLVVIGVISLLVAILLPALRKARLTAEATVCAGNMRQIGLGFQMYCDANHGWLPACGEDGDSGAPLQGPDNRGWASEGLWFNAVNRATFGMTYDQIQLDAMAGHGRVPREGDHHVLVCPSARPASGASPGADAADAEQMSPDGYYFLTNGYVNDAAGNLGTDQLRDTFICYAMNYKLFGANVYAGKYTQLLPASAVVVVFEKRTNGGEVTPADDAYYASVGGGSGKITTAPLGRFKGDWKRLATRHNGGGNLLFADGHVSPITLHDAMTPPTVGVANWNRPATLVWNITGPATP